MNKKIVFAILAALIFVLGTAFVLWIRPPKGYSGKTESITIAPSNAPAIIPYITVAQEQRFFTRNGLKVTVRDFAEGLYKLSALLKGDLDIAGASEYPVVGKAFNNERVCIIATVSKANTFFLVGRKDRGIEHIGDLKGKRIGLTLGTINEFYLGRFLNLNGIQLGDVTLVNFTLSQLEDALADGRVDAAMTRGPFLSGLRKRLAANGVSWPAQSYQPTFGIMACRSQWIRQNPELVRRYLNALSEAEDYMNKHPPELEAVIEKLSNHDKEAAASFQKGAQYSLSLDQSLIAAMEDEARWMIKNKLTSEKQVPDFLNYIYVDGLKAIKPEAVNIIR